MRQPIVQSASENADCVGLCRVVFGEAAHTFTTAPWPTCLRRTASRGTREPMEALEQELKQLIVESLMLDDVDAGQIESTAPLFVDGLGLDSIDALELAMAIERRFGVKFSPDDERNREIFANVKNLAAYVAEETRP
jgi:acyl carrier protein